MVQAEQRLDVAQLEKREAVVEAEQRLEVAELDRQVAAERKQEEILLGQGEAERGCGGLVLIRTAESGGLKQALSQNPWKNLASS